VTAVLLDVRAYDTLLETAVLWIALLGVAVLGPERPPVRESAPPVLVGLARMLVPLMILLAGWLLWQGAAATGGAFQAAAVLAAGGILARLAGFPVPPVDSPLIRRWLAALGTAVFLGVAVVLMSGGQLLEYPAGARATLVLMIEAAVTVAIATILVALFDAVGPRRREADG
jgi:multisubunit Na+/H+ antiporter MnhB subunit